MHMYRTRTQYTWSKCVWQSLKFICSTEITLYNVLQFNSHNIFRHLTLFNDPSSSIQLWTTYSVLDDFLIYPQIADRMQCYNGLLDLIFHFWVYIASYTDIDTCDKMRLQNSLLWFVWNAVILHLKSKYNYDANAMIHLMMSDVGCWMGRGMMANEQQHNMQFKMKYPSPRNCWWMCSRCSYNVMHIHFDGELLHRIPMNLQFQVTGMLDAIE